MVTFQICTANLYESLIVMSYYIRSSFSLTILCNNFMSQSIFFLSLSLSPKVQICGRLRPCSQKRNIFRILYSFLCTHKICLYGFYCSTLQIRLDQNNVFTLQQKKSSFPAILGIDLNLKNKYNSIFSFLSPMYHLINFNKIIFKFNLNQTHPFFLFFKYILDMKYLYTQAFWRLTPLTIVFVSNELMSSLSKL